MRRKKADRYDIDKIPIREELRNAIKTRKLVEIAAIDVYQGIGRMQGIQDEFIQELIDGVLDKIAALQTDITAIKGCLEERIAVLEEKVA